MSETQKPPVTASSPTTVGDSVLMLYQGQAPHPAHRTFGDAVDADYRHFETGDIPDPDVSGTAPAPWEGSLPNRIKTGLSLGAHDILIAEGSAPLQTALVYGSRNSDASVLYLAADETFYSIEERASRHIWRGLRPVADHVLDGIITVSRDAYEWASPHVGRQPCRVVHPPISDSKHALLREIKPTSPSDPFRILTAGNAQTAKQPTMLTDAVDQFRTDYDGDIELVFLGRGHDDEPYAADDWVRTPGYVPLEEFASWFQKASVYVQPSDGDSYPVASLEGMISATPTIVTNGCGTRRRVGDDLVAEPTASSIAARLETVAGWSQTDREKRGRTHRESVRNLTTDGQAHKFATAVQELIQ